MSCGEGSDEGERNVVCHASSFLAIYCGILSCSCKQQATAGSATDSFWVHCAQRSRAAGESASSLLITPGTSARICKTELKHWKKWNPSAWRSDANCSWTCSIFSRALRRARAPWESKGLGTDCCQHRGTCTNHRENLYILFYQNYFITCYLQFKRSL